MQYKTAVSSQKKFLGSLCALDANAQYLRTGKRRTMNPASTTTKAPPLFILRRLAIFHRKVSRFSHRWEIMGKGRTKALGVPRGCLEAPFARHGKKSAACQKKLYLCTAETAPAMTENAHRTHPPRRSILVRWDAAGNLGQLSTMDEHSGEVRSRFLLWTEDNRLHTVVDDRHHSYYAYDHAGERAMKVTGHSHQLDVNADLMHTAAGLDEFTLYPSPYLVFTNRGYTKHYYAGTERLAARIGGGFGKPILAEQPQASQQAKRLFEQCQKETEKRVLEAPPAHTIRRDHLPENIYMAMTREFEAPMHLEANVVIKSNDLISTAQNIVAGNAEPNVYFYHSDHLGSASWITEAGGKPVQHIQYLPYGEPFVNQRVSGYNERFTFTGKERDEETGYSYFGARYMEHEILTSFISVDRYASKYPFISPYAYCAWNPLRITDPNGDSIRLEGTADQRQKVLDYLHQYSHLTFQCDEKGYITLNTNLPGSEIKNHSDQYIADIIKDNINIVVIEIMETDNVASKGVRMQKDNPTLFGATSDYPKDGNWETGRVEGKQFLNINLLGSICGNDNESKTYPGRIIMHEFSEGFEGCKLARELQRPLTMSQKDYFWSHSRANNHVWGEFTSPGENGKIKLRSEYIGK